MRKLIIALSVLGAVAGLAAVSAEAAAPRGPARFYDRNGNFAGYSWCQKEGMFIHDCNYFTYQQCYDRASGSRNYCVPNPYAVEQGYNPWAAEQAAPVSRKKVRLQQPY
jgi:hypothetical protein